MREAKLIPVLLILGGIVMWSLVRGGGQHTDSARTPSSGAATASQVAAPHLPPDQQPSTSAGQVASRVLVAMNSFTPIDPGLGAWLAHVKPDLTTSAYAYYKAIYPKPLSSAWWRSTVSASGTQTATVATITADPTQRRTNTPRHVSLLVALDVTSQNVTYPDTMADPTALPPTYAVNLDLVGGRWQISWIHNAETAPAHYGTLKLTRSARNR